MNSTRTRRNELTRRRLCPDRINRITHKRPLDTQRALCVYRKTIYSGGTMWASSPTIFNRTSIVRIPYVKYSTGANETARTAHRALGKPDWTAARRAFLNGRTFGEWQAEANCFSARQRYFASSASFPPFFSGKTEKNGPPEASCTIRRSLSLMPSSAPRRSLRHRDRGSPSWDSSSPRPPGLRSPAPAAAPDRASGRRGRASPP